jgi:hypothetical protein
MTMGFKPRTSKECWHARAPPLVGSGHRFTEAFYLEQLGHTYARSDSAYRAIELYEQALAIFRELGDQQGEGGVLSRLKALHKEFDDSRRYIKAFERYAAISRAEGNFPGVLPLMCPTTCATEYFGGIEIMMCTWSSSRCPSSTVDSRCSVSVRKTYPR